MFSRSTRLGAFLVAAALLVSPGCNGDDGDKDPADSTADLAFIGGSWTITLQGIGTTENCAGPALPPGGVPNVFCPSYDLSITQTAIDATSADLTGTVSSLGCLPVAASLTGQIVLTSGISRIESGAFNFAYSGATAQMWFEGVATDDTLTIDFTLLEVSGGGLDFSCDLDATYTGTR